MRTARAGPWAAAATLALSFAFLYGPPAGTALQEEEAIVPELAARAAGVPGRLLWNPSPYDGGLVMTGFRLLWTAVEPSFGAVRAFYAAGAAAAALAAGAGGLLLGGPAGAAAAAAAVVFSPLAWSVIRHDIASVGPAVALQAASVALGLALGRSPSAALALGCGAAAGLAVWNHALSAVPVLSWGASRLWPGLSRRHALWVAAGLFAGALPFLASEARGGARALRWALDPTLADSRGPSPQPLSRRWGVVTGFLSGRTAGSFFSAEPAALSGMPLYLASAAAACAWPGAARAAAAPFALSVLILLLLPPARDSHHGALALLSGLALLVGAAAGDWRARLAARPNAAWAGLAALALGLFLDARMTLILRARALAGDVAPARSGPIQEGLVAALRGEPAPVPLDWGLYHSLRLRGVRWVGWEELYDALERGRDPGAAAARAVKEGSIFVAHAPRHAVRRDLRAALMKAAASQGMEAAPAGVIGPPEDPYYELFRLRRRRASAGR